MTDKEKALIELPTPQETHSLVRNGDIKRLEELFNNLPPEDGSNMIERHAFHTGAQFGFQESSQWLRIWESILAGLEPHRRKEVLKNLSDTVIALLIDAKAGEFCSFLADLEVSRIQNVLDTVPSIWKDRMLNPDNLIHVLYTMLEQGAEISAEFLNSLDPIMLAYPLAMKFDKKRIEVMDLTEMIDDEEEQTDPYAIFLERLEDRTLTPEQLGIEDEEVNSVYTALYNVEAELFHEIVEVALTRSLSELRDRVMEGYQFRQDERLAIGGVDSGDDWSDYED
ncbi:MAG: hypothetical protein Kow0090_15800 [Myxococcota bacterium]